MPGGPVLGGPSLENQAHAVDKALIFCCLWSKPLEYDQWEWRQGRAGIQKDQRIRKDSASNH